MIYELEEGSSVVFNPKDGRSTEIKSAKKRLKIGAEYVISKIDRGMFSEYIFLEGHKNSFNSIMFEKVR